MKRLLVIFVLLAGLSPGAASEAASTQPGIDLVLLSVSRPSARLAAGSTFLERFAERNIGDRGAPASTTAFYLSPARHLKRGAIHLLGTGRVRALRSGRKVQVSDWLTVPTSTPAGSYWLLGCANGGQRLKERNRRNDCRATVLAVAVGSRPSSGSGGSAGGAGGSSGSGGSTSAGGTGSICVASRHPTLASARPDCFDGDAALGIFVSGLGDDANPGTISAPKRTLAAGVTAAAAQGKDVYATLGVYPEMLRLANGVSVYGGYDALWQRSPSNVTKITGSGAVSEAVYATGITRPTTVQLLTLAPGPSSLPGESSYGVGGAGSPALVLDHVTVLAARGTDGSSGAAGAPGVPGGNGHSSNGQVGAAGGVGAGGRVGGDGGLGGYDGASGAAGGSGLSTTPDEWGRMGGPGGAGGKGGPDPGSGLPGENGDSGHVGADGSGGGSGNVTAGSRFWVTESGRNGQPGSDGHGGGGGGGGGTAGQGGGGSFGIFLEDSAGALVRDSHITASDGGAGGRGGVGGFPGTGGLGGTGYHGDGGTGLCTAGAARGGSGGLGGPGGLGGNGGGGAGGPSVAIYGVGAANAPGTTVSHGHGGAGGNGAGRAGADGVVADYL